MKKNRIIHELKKHIPFTAIATLIAILVTLFILYGIKKEIPESFFHILHPFTIAVIVYSSRNSRL